MLVKWSQKYSVEDATLDAQHQRMFEIMNALYAEMRAGTLSHSQQQNILESLVQYGETHFRAEEDAMRACGYPDLPAHIAEHQRYRLEIQRLAVQLAGDKHRTPDERENFPHELLNFLKAWWTKHIVHQDRDYIPFLRRATGKK
jgi:hemerythrin